MTEKEALQKIDEILAEALLRGAISHNGDLRRLTEALEAAGHSLASTLYQPTHPWKKHHAASSEPPASEPQI